ncbi:MAG: DUF3488 and transglutaminase-like domain-containing protein [Thermodesulfovibrionaceae bacterium]
MINVVSVALIFQALVNISPEDILTPSLEALTLILSIRFIGKKTSREYFQIYLLSLLLLGASTIFDISWFFLIKVTIFLLLTISSILLLTYMKETLQETLSAQVFLNLIKFAFVISFLSIPLSALFFVILPRAPNPLFDIGFAKAKTGFSSTVSLGSVVSIEEDRTVVMRVKMREIPEKELYWRVITFDSFDGKNWFKTVKDGSPKMLSGDKISYTVTLESLTEQYLPTLDYPLNIYLPNISYEYPGVFRIKFPSEKLVKYSAISFINFTLIEENFSAVYLNLPQNISKRFIKLTEEITKGEVLPEETVKKILKFLSTYQYSLKNLPLSDNPIEEFLFIKKSGNCEYFATVMALMLRVKGIPSRVVGGFRGGSYNPFGGYYLIRASDAHLWVEAWIEGRWVRFDPSGRPTRKSESVVFNVLDYLWNTLVINYDLKTQIKLAKSLTIPKFDFKKTNLFYFVGLITVVILSFHLYRLTKIRKDPLQRFVKELNKHGLKIEKNQGLEEFLEKIENIGLKEKALEFVKAYEEIYFKDKKFTKYDLEKLNKIVDEIYEDFQSRRSKNQ